jgi:HEAT repeat protein
MDPSTEVRLAAAVALDALVWQPTGDDQKAIAAIARNEWEKVVGIGGVAVGPLLSIASYPDGDSRENALECLEKMSWEPSNDEERTKYLSAIGDWDGCADLGVSSVDALDAALQNRNVKGRKGAAKALGKIRDARAAPPLLRALQDPDADVRQAAASALGQIGDNLAAGRLIQTLREDDNSWVRAAAASSLGKIGDPTALPALIASVKRWWSTEAGRKEAEEAGQKGNPTYLRRAAAVALGQLGDPAAVESLIEAARDPDEMVRESAVESLGKVGRLGDARLIEFLLDMTENGKHNDRFVASEALKLLGNRH